MRNNDNTNNKMDVSIVILNYNTKDLTLACIKSIIKYTKKIRYEIVVVDNGSNDDSVKVFKNIKNKNIKVIENKRNLGFARGNNTARKVVNGKYVLFLNSDTEFTENVLEKCVEYFESGKNIGALTVKQVLANGKLDKDARRSFPTPWVAFTHFSKLDRILPKSKLFAKYWMTYQSADKNQKIEALQGAFFMSPKKVLDKVGWFDEDYFLDGEDIDLSWKINNAGYKNFYLADVQIIHLKGVSKGKKGTGGKKSFSDRVKYVTQGVNSMEIFYRKRLWGKYNILVNYMMIYLIKVMKIYRVVMLIVRR